MLTVATNVIVKVENKVIKQANSEAAQFYEDIMRLKALMVHRARVGEFVKGLASAQAKTDEVLS